MTAITIPEMFDVWDADTGDLIGTHLTRDLMTELVETEFNGSRDTNEVLELAGAGEYPFPALQVGWLTIMRRH